MSEDTSSPTNLCRVEIADGSVRVEGPGLLEDRQARLFFGSLLGGKANESGWTVRPKNRNVDDLVVRVNRWLEKRGRSSELVGAADESVKRDERRQKSYERARQAALALRRGESRFATTEIEAMLAEAGWNSAERTLRPHQVEAVIHGLSAANPANFSVPGAGKTASTLALAAIHLNNNDADLVLVIGPLSCFQPWESETAVCLPALSTRRIRGTAQQRRTRIKNLGAGTIALISYASAAADYRQLVELCRSQRVMLVADESHRIKRFAGGTWAPAIVEVANYAHIRVILSGTPMPQSGRDLYTQLNVLWPGKELTGPRQRFANAVDKRFSSVLEDVIPFVSRTPKAALGLDPPLIHQVNVPMGENEAGIYRLVVENFRRRVQASGGSAAAQLESLRRGRPIRLLQAATNPALLRSGVILSSEEASSSPMDGNPTLLTRLHSYDPLKTPPAKFVEARRIIESSPADQKFVVWSTFIGNLDAFSEYLRLVSSIKVFQVDGRVQAGDSEERPASGEEPETREQVISRFLSTSGKAVLVTNPASCSESISLHSSCHNAIYLDRTYDCAQWLQSIDRIHRLGLPSGAEVNIYVLESFTGDNSTADRLVADSLQRKESQLRELLEGAALQPFDRSDDPLVEAEGDLDDLRAIVRYLLGDA
ncbi:DEAD/DEAH box helicase [Pseudonocardia alni]|uniref:DEAD/DEAH box helicase n=1 Tax=Pseudonocardia alni TaxID=33907 RepID=UPI003324E005